MLSWFPRFVHSERRREKGKPMLSLSVWLITLKCYPGFLGLFPVKEKKKREKSYAEPFSSTDNTQMLSWFPRFVYCERREKKPTLSLPVWLIVLEWDPGFRCLLSAVSEDAACWPEGSPTHWNTRTHNHQACAARSTFSLPACSRAGGSQTHLSKLMARTLHRYTADQPCLCSV